MRTKQGADNQQSAGNGIVPGLIAQVALLADY